jgi:nucleoside-diphosphate-sugar epimerase
MDRPSLILLTGGTGYVGGRLLQSLEDGGYRVRSMARRPEALRGRVRASTESFLATASIQNLLIPHWRECTRHTIWFIPWAPLAPLKKKIGKQPAILQKPLV